MGLRDRSFASSMVEVPGGDPIAVRGLNPDKVIDLCNRHAGQLSGLWDSRENVSDVQELVVGLLTDAPGIMAELITLAAGGRSSDTQVENDPGINPLGLTDYERDVAYIRELPLPVQIDALLKIGDLTFSSSMPPGKFLAVVIKMAGTATAALNQPGKK